MRALKTERLTKRFSRALSAAKECAPGTCFHYNNAIYELTLEILEKVDSRPYMEILKRDVLTPLGLTSTNASFVELKQSGNYILPHLFQKRRFVGNGTLDAVLPLPQGRQLNRT